MRSAKADLNADVMSGDHKLRKIVCSNGNAEKQSPSWQNT